MTRVDGGRATEGASVGAGLAQHEPVRWLVNWRVEKYEGEIDPAALAAGLLTPYETVAGEGNLLTTAGATALWTLLIGGGGTTFSNANAYLGVGDSSTAAAVGQTDLQAASNKLRKAMDATFPTVATDTITFKSTFGTGDANWAWQEWAVFNASSGGTMLNRKVASLGTKTSSGSWVLTVSITIS